MTSFDLFGDVSVVDTGERNAFDYYPTPAWMTRSLLRHHPSIAGCGVMEPCAGAGAMSVVLEAAGCAVIESDIDPRHQRRFNGDATLASFWEPWMVQWVITNPPFNVAFPILQCALEHATDGVAFLLRKTFLEPTNIRGPWLQEHPPTRIIGQPRYSFRGTGSDSVSCDWCIWEKHPDRSLQPIVIDYVAEESA